MRFRRVLWGAFKMWHDLQKMCEGVALNHDNDKLVWMIGANGTFSVHSFYCVLKMQAN